MARFFIGRPIFAIVIAILIMLAGGLAIVSLPIEQYPTIAPPSIQIQATYNGASAQTVENTVVQVIEQQMGLRVTKSSNSYLIIAGFVSGDGSMSRYDIANYVVSHVQDPLSRLDGV